MKKQLLFLSFIFILISSIFYSCTKDIGKNPLLGYGDKPLFDSCKKADGLYYYKGSSAVIANDPAAGSPHGSFKLKFNSIANSMLTDGGMIPAGQVFPNGSMVIKETTSGLYAFLYKREGSWLYGEVNQQSGKVVHSVSAEPSICTGCHNFASRDHVISFDFY